MAGVLTRRNIIVIFMSIELILNAANLNFIAVSRYLQDTGNVNAVAGQIFTVFVIVVAAAEAAIGLGIVIALYRNKETIWVDEIDILEVVSTGLEFQVPSFEFLRLDATTRTLEDLRLETRH